MQYHAFVISSNNEEMLLRWIWYRKTIRFWVMGKRYIMLLPYNICNKFYLLACGWNVFNGIHNFAWSKYNEIWLPFHHIGCPNRTLGGPYFYKLLVTSKSNNRKWPKFWFAILIDTTINISISKNLLLVQWIDIIVY